MRTTILLAIGFALTEISAPAKLSAQECDAMLHQGIFDVSKTSSSVTTAYQFSSWFCDQKFSSASSAESYGGSVIAPFEGVPVKLGWDQSKDSYQSWQSKFCATERYSDSMQRNIQEHISKVNQGLLDTFLQCINADGLHVWIAPTNDLHRLRLAFRYIADGDVATARIEKVTTSPNLDCDENIGERGFTGLTVTNRDPTINCTRTDNLAADITINKSSNKVKGGESLILPPIPQPLPAPRPIPAAACVFLPGVLKLLGSAASLSLNAGKGNSVTVDGQNVKKPLDQVILLSGDSRCISVDESIYRIKAHNIVVPHGKPTRIAITATTVPSHETCSKPSREFEEIEIAAAEKNQCN